MTKKNFGAALQHTVEQQDASLKKRFEAADSVLLSEPRSDLKARVAERAPGKAEKAPRAGSAEATKKLSAPAGDLAVRDTFSMPPEEYEVIDRVRNKVAREGFIYSKSEVVRAALAALGAMQTKDLVYLLSKVERIKPGRKT
jgi:Arc/MetJ-type ribon-helix-helix transcriptional regulator